MYSWRLYFFINIVYYIYFLMNTRSKVIAKLQQDLSSRFSVIDNTGEDKKVIGGQIPDVIIFKKEPPLNNEVLFVLKIENGGELVDSLSQWKGLSSLPSSFYIVVPRKKLDEAKKLASAFEVKARFAHYEINDAGEVTQIQYE